MVSLAAVEKLASRIDIFRFPATVRFVPEYVASKRSTIATVVVGVATLIYLSLTIDRFVNVAPVIKISQRDGSLEGSFAPELALAVRYGPGYATVLQNTTLVRAHIRQGTIRDANTVRTSTPLRSEQCNVAWLSGAPPFPGWCTPDPAHLRGQLSSVLFQYLWIDLVTEDVAAMVAHDPRVFLYINTKDGDGKAKQVILFYYPLQEMQTFAEIKMRKVEVTRTPNFITSFADRRSDVLAYLDEKAYIKQNQQRNGSESVFFTLWVRMDDTILEEERRSPTIFDAISAVGALFSTLVSALGLYFVAHNQKTFYALYPNMDNVPLSSASLTGDRSVELTPRGGQSTPGGQVVNPLAKHAGQPGGAEKRKAPEH